MRPLPSTDCSFPVTTRREGGGRSKSMRPSPKYAWAGNIRALFLAVKIYSMNLFIYIIFRFFEYFFACVHYPEFKKKTGNKCKYLCNYLFVLIFTCFPPQKCKFLFKKNLINSYEIFALKNNSYKSLHLSRAPPPRPSRPFLGSSPPPDFSQPPVYIIVSASL